MTTDDKKLGLLAIAIGTYPDVIIYDEASEIGEGVFTAFDHVFALDTGNRQVTVYAEAARYAWPDDDIVWTGHHTFPERPPEPPAPLKIREHKHWTQLNGGAQPWKVKQRKGRRH